MVIERCGSYVVQVAVGWYRQDASYEWVQVGANCFSEQLQGGSRREVMVCVCLVVDASLTSPGLG
jgi:hypothetical protein